MGDYGLGPLMPQEWPALGRKSPLFNGILPTFLLGRGLIEAKTFRYNPQLLTPDRPVSLPCYPPPKFIPSCQSTACQWEQHSAKDLKFHRAISLSSRGRHERNRRVQLSQLWIPEHRVSLGPPLLQTTRKVPEKPRWSGRSPVR